MKTHKRSTILSRNSPVPVRSFCARRGVAHSPTTGRSGLTLFEVLVALAIFVGSASIITQLVATGARGAVHARLQTQAVLRCESVMAEVVSGYVPLQMVSNASFVDDPSWSWSLNLAAGPQVDLYMIEVTVSRSGGIAGDISFTLHRYLRDPQMYLDALAEREAAAAEAASSTSSTQSTGGTR